MPEQSDLDRRLRAVERALTDGDQDVMDLQDAAAIDDRLTAIERRIDALEERTAELDAATQAVRGYVGNVRSVNDEVEARADAALAAVDRIEVLLDDRDGSPGNDGGVPSERDSGLNRPRRGESTSRSHQETDARDQYGIEMPPPGRNGGKSTDAEGSGEGAESRTVVDRVREVL